MVTSAQKKSTKLSAFVQFIAVSCIAGIVSAGLAIPSVGMAAAGADTAVDVFNALPTELEERPLAQRSRMLAADGSEIAEFYWQNRQEVAFDEISQEMKDATVAVEDYRFYEHSGVDFQGIARAVVHNMVSSSTQGGSTLTQQYVKNVLAENAHAENDAEGVEAAKESDGTAGYARKLREAKLAVAVENKYGKDEILHRYLNINNYSGSPAVFGVEAAAYRYWGISAAELNIQQSATLAGIVQNPSANNPERFPEQTLKRRNTVLALMHQHGFITEEEYTEVKDTDLDLDIHTTPNGCAAAGNKAYFCDYVQRVIENDEAFGEEPAERTNFLNRGGLTIKTTLDPAIQDIADKALKDRIPADDASHAGHAASTVEPGTGRIVAMAQNRNYTVTETDSEADTQINYNVDRKHNGSNGFQIGSTWKPMVLTEWLKEGKGLGTTVNATRRNFTAGSWRYDGCPNMGGPWNPRNAGDGSGSSSMSALQATKSSTNTAYAAMGNQLNMCGIMKTAESLGIKYGSGEPLDTPDADGYIAALGPASILGVVQVTPLDMAAAFATFAADGEYCRPVAIDSITTNDGEEIEVPGADCTQTLEKDVAKGVSYAMSQTFNGGTTSGLGIGVPAAGKTGTTNFEVGSTTFAGFTRTLSTFVWTGDPDRNRDWRTEGAGSVRGRIYGATISGKTWQNIMRQAVTHTEGNSGFSRPGGSAGGSQGSYRAPSSERGDGGGNRGGGGGGNGGGGGGNSDNGGGRAGLGGN
ncbi:transglycosylase domain-containing protein [Brevibacterium album]|uniref:transglycosylase domain-containing protein n=1 Tax=Brevibacterium album TaxID=417948 RepID=UPI000409C01D|nr:transglycosylase domain-containing protein [Brevibacterium album]